MQRYSGIALGSGILILLLIAEIKLHVHKDGRQEMLLPLLSRQHFEAVGMLA